MDYTGQKFLQNCGDYLIIDKKSDKKELDFYGKLILKGIPKNYTLDKIIFLKETYVIQKNLINMDSFVTKNT